MRDLIETVCEPSVHSLGAYYTPDLTALAIVRWAIRTGNENLLEPSAGGGALLRAAFAHAHNVSAGAQCHATAFDIDPKAISNLHALNNEKLKVVHADFLESKSEAYGKFDLILANPPFNRNHSLSPELRSNLRSRFSIKGPVGIWVYFLIHSLAFLKPGGRLVSIVPKSALFTLHGHEFLNRLCRSFCSVGAYELKSKPTWSSYAEEAGAVVFADNFLGGSCDVYEKGTLDDDGTISVRERTESDTYQTLLRNTRPLEDYARLSIGAVTGRNNVFLLSELERSEAGIAREDVLPVVSRRKQISGISISVNELEKLAGVGQKTWLLYPRALTKDVAQYLSSVPESDREAVVWFRKRDPWWKVQVANEYHAVFTYMNDLGPRLVRLEPNIVCTNTMHRVEFLEATSEAEKVAAFLTPISTFGQLAAEKLGRAYSGGVLKFEIVEARKLPILNPPAVLPADLFENVDKLLRCGEYEPARIVVDQAFMPSVFGDCWRKKCEELEGELSLLRAARRGRKNGN